MPVEPLDSNSGASASVEPALKPEQPRATDIDKDEEERRRAGRSGGGDINPANASHSLNMRPDVTQGPAGLEVRTTMKSADYRANPDLKADLAEADHGQHPQRHGDALEGVQRGRTGP